MTAVEAYEIRVPDEELEDLRRRLRDARWPEKETVDDWSQGVPLSYLREVCEYWANEYDWRRVESRLNSFGSFRTVVDGIGIHALHVRSPEPDAMPLVMTHGWPGSIVEFLDVIGPLTDPASHGGDPKDAFHVVVPSMPGFGFSDKPTASGWTTEKIADAWIEIMARLGYDRFAVQGGDYGALISQNIAQAQPEQVIALHLSSPTRFPRPEETAENDAERAALARVQKYLDEEVGYAKVQMTRPQTIGYGLADSPVGQAGWLLQGFWQWTDFEEHISEVFTLDQLLDNVMMYWVTNSGASSARAYWESYASSLKYADSPVTVPMGMSVHPADITRLSRRWVEKEFTDIRYWTEVPKGGHQGAFEQPAQFTDEVRTFFRMFR
ncbi:epoxide hydrolase [Nocardioides immobilis]|uniref:Epoxide hydrolase n=1 Tax=Nocardioides immobilis TaxID=2049295 RepID=A0A417Y0Q6_9ACTN|nr:epoxide hydrolase family protein [Nocardioides immobilis]RHW26240.1 epoxide hydrolase [Nocardioides immobilis]